MNHKITLATPITHTDWMWNHSKRIGHGEKSVQYILDRCKSIGIDRVYWRCFDGGQALYASRLMDSVAVGYAADNYHAWANPAMDIKTWLKGYHRFDSLEAAVAYGHKIGLEVHAWLTINEDDHAWGLQSRFTKAHPQFRWVKRNGCPYNSQLSFAFPEVREYKLALIKEILHYDVDGFFFDWIRTGDIRNGPQADATGTADFGYETPLVEGFKKTYKKDPRQIPNNDVQWVRYRCEPQTLFMREARKLIQRKDKFLPIAMMGHHPWSFRGDSPKVDANQNGLLLDVAGWAREGLIDEVVAAGYYRKGGTPQKAFAYLKAEVKNHCKIWHYAWMPATMAQFEQSLKMALKLDASQILYWESDYIDNPGNAEFAREIVKRNEMLIGCGKAK